MQIEIEIVGFEEEMPSRLDSFDASNFPRVISAENGFLIDENDLNPDNQACNIWALSLISIEMRITQFKQIRKSFFLLLISCFLRLNCRAQLVKVLFCFGHITLIPSIIAYLVWSAKLSKTH